MGLTKDASDDLEALLASKGWMLLSAAARGECAIRKDRGSRDAVNDANDSAALNKLRQVFAFESGVEFVLKLPGFLIEKADRGESSPVTSPSRRGSL